MALKMKNNTKSTLAILHKIWTIHIILVMPTISFLFERIDATKSITIVGSHYMLLDPLIMLA